MAARRQNDFVLSKVQLDYSTMRRQGDDRDQPLFPKSPTNVLVMVRRLHNDLGTNRGQLRYSALPRCWDDRNRISLLLLLLHVYTMDQLQHSDPGWRTTSPGSA